MYRKIINKPNPLINYDTKTETITQYKANEYLLIEKIPILLIENRQIENKRSDFLFLRVLFPFLNLSKLLCVEFFLHMLDANSFEVFLLDLFVDVNSVLMQSTLYS